MTAYTIDFDDKIDEALEAARAANAPNDTAGEYLAIVLGGYLVDYCKQYEPALKAAEAAVKVAREAVEAKYAKTVAVEEDK
jgi:hypothetical protein